MLHEYRVFTLKSPFSATYGDSYQPPERQLSLRERQNGTVSVFSTHFPPSSVTIARELYIPCGESGFRRPQPRELRGLWPYKENSPDIPSFFTQTPRRDRIPGQIGFHGAIYTAFRGRRVEQIAEIPG